MQQKSLLSLDIGKTYVLSHVDLQGALRQRILDLGFTEGAEIKCLFKAPSGSPLAFLIRGSVIALRKTDAEKIFVL